MGYDPDPPTRRIPPQPPAGAPAARVHETEYVADDARHQQLLDRIRSLQTALALVGLLAAAALGVALYTLLSGDEEGDGRGASRQSVSRLQDDVERLEERVEGRATEGDVNELREDVTGLQEQVEQASSQDDGAAEAQQAVEDLQGDIQELEQRLEAVEQSAGAEEQGGETTP